MNKIGKLINELCPNGVEYKEIGEIFTVKNGYTPSKNKPEFWDDGDIPWFRLEDIRNNGKILNESIQHITEKAVKGNLFKKNSLMVATTATIGIHALIEVDFLCNQQLTCVTIKDEYENYLNIKFYYYYFDLVDKECIRIANNGGGMPIVSLEKMKKIKVPVPPLDVQYEIVRILDKFSLLSSELSNELIARQRQYDFYKYKLLSNDSIEHKLGEVANIKTGVKPKDILDKGDYEYINAGTTNSGYVNETNFNGDVVTTPSRGQGGIGYVGYQNKDFWLGPLCYAIWSKDETVLINKYLYYELSRSEEHTSELQSPDHLVCRLL